MRTCIIASDHAGYDFKCEMINYLSSMNFNVVDCGTNDGNTSCDYPDFVYLAALKMNKELSLEKDTFCILICGSGIGVSMAANRYEFLRAALCWNEEVSEITRKHNNANTLCMPARFISIDLGKKIIDKFTETSFDGGRHQKRVEKIKRQDFN